MTALRHLLAWLGLAAPDSGWCTCGHNWEGHEHYSSVGATYCAFCGWRTCPRYRPGPLPGVGEVDRLIAAAWEHSRRAERADAERAVHAVATHGPDATWRLLAWCASAVLDTADLDDLPIEPDWDDAAAWAGTFVHAYDLQLHGQERVQYERLGPVDQHERAVALLHLAVTALEQEVA